MSKKVYTEGMEHAVGITLNAEVEREWDGKVTLRIKAREMPPEMMQELRQIFPNSMDRIYGLLDNEILFSSVCKD